jgi:hypothetical protein
LRKAAPVTRLLRTYSQSSIVAAVPKAPYVSSDLPSLGAK